MTLTNAIKVLDDKIKANQAEYNLDREEVKSCTVIWRIEKI